MPIDQKTNVHVSTRSLKQSTRNISISLNNTESVINTTSSLKPNFVYETTTPNFVYETTTPNLSKPISKKILSFEYQVFVENFRYILMTVFFLFAIVLPSILWYKRRDTFIKKIPNDLFESSNSNNLDTD